MADEEDDYDDYYEDDDSSSVDYDFLEIDSPMEPKADLPDEDEELQEGLNQASSSLAAASSSATTSQNKQRPTKVPRQPPPPRDRRKLMDWPESLPYKCETLEEFDGRLDFIYHRLCQCIRTKDYDIGLIQWNHKLQCLMSLKYPMQRATRAALAGLYYEVIFIPGLEHRIIEPIATMAQTLLAPKRLISIRDLRLPWKPLFDMLSDQLFPKSRASHLTGLSNTLLDLAEVAQRFFPSSEVDAMLEAILPQLDGSNINSVIAVEAYLVHFLPLRKPQHWLPAMFRLWDTFESGLFDDQFLDLLARLCEMHAGAISPPADEEPARDGASPPPSSPKGGLWKEVGLFTKEQFSLIMTKLLRSAGIPVGANRHAAAQLTSQMAGVRTGNDSAVADTILQMHKPTSCLQSFATILVYSMSIDGSIAEPQPEPTRESVESAAGASGQSTPSGSDSHAYVAGSQSLDAYVRLLQATETFFHPSNTGHWQMILTALVSDISKLFLQRWKEEQRADCKTPADRRLTPMMKREFVKASRTVCFLSIFGKTEVTVGATQLALKRLAILEPDLIVPAALDRAYPGLQELETSHRTTSLLSTLSAVSIPLVSRSLYPAGGKHILPLLSLCLPALDPTDAHKTLYACAFLTRTLWTIRIDDLTRPELMDDDAGMSIDGEGQDTAAIQRKEEDDALRMSTAGFEEWVVEFLSRIFTILDSLPDEGAKGKVGGKQEEAVIAGILSLTDSVFWALAPSMHERVLETLIKYTTDHISGSAVRAISTVIGSFGRVNPSLTLAKMLPLADQRIRLELDHGASSTRTTATHTPSSSDTTLHWYLSALAGCISHTGTALLEYKGQLLALLHLLIDRTRSERGYSMSAGILQRLLSDLTSVYVVEYHFLNPDEWKDSRVEKQSHQYWGKLYEAKDVKLTWHVPNEAEVDFAIEAMKTFVDPALDELDRLQQVPQQQRDKTWSNDFCRRLSLVRAAWLGQVSMIQDADVGDGEKLSDAGVESTDFLRPYQRVASGFTLTDPESPHYQYVKSFRVRFGEVLHNCATSSDASEAEDKQDCTRLLLRSIRTWMVDYAYGTAEYNNHQASLAYLRASFKMHPRQREQPRQLWAKRAAFYHVSRARLNTFYSARTALHDKLIKNVVLELCMSSYAGIRKLAQSTLDKIASLRDGTRLLCMPILLQNIRSGVEDDRMKGALHVLGSKGFAALGVVDPRFTPDFLSCLLSAQHHPKPSLQKLVRAILSDFCARFAEPLTVRFSLEPHQRLLTIVQDTERKLAEEHRQVQDEAAMLSEVTAKRAERVDNLEHLQERLLPNLLKVASGEDVHWSFRHYATKTLRALIRRDKPIPAALASFFAKELTADNPTIRATATGAMTKILFFFKLRTMAANDQQLLDNKAVNPLKKIEKLSLPVSADFEKELFDSFGRGRDEGDVKLRDQSVTGWLAWGAEEKYYELPPVTGPHTNWDPESSEAIKALRYVVEDTEFWRHYFRIISQEKSRAVPAWANSVLFKSFAQIYGVAFSNTICPLVNELLTERDRHKARAAGEAIIGFLRGIKHWPLEDQDKFWAWLVPHLPGIFKDSTLDSQPVWEEVMRSAFERRDPRRCIPVLDFVLGKAREYLESGDEVESVTVPVLAHTFLRSCIVAMDRKFLCMAPEFAEKYLKQTDTAYTELRSIQSETITDLDLLHVAPQHASVKEFLDDANRAISDSTSAGRLALMNAVYKKRFEQIRADLAQWRPERIPTSQGTSKYDCAAMSTLLWMTSTLSDHRRSKLDAFAIEFLPEIFLMLEVKDNAELTSKAQYALGKIATHHFGPGPLPGKLVSTLLSIIEQSTDSWRTRLQALSILQVAYFQNFFYLTSSDVEQIISVLLKFLKDAHPEVREMVATSLSGIVRCSPRSIIADLKQRFTHTVVSTVLPERGTPTYASSLITLHSGILGVTALLQAFPYEVPPWMPSLLLQTVCQHTDDPVPISTTIKKCAREFRRTHTDNWHESEKVFTSEELDEVNAWTLGRSEYMA